MKVRDRLFGWLLAASVAATLANLLLMGAQRAVFVDATGKPLGVATRIHCPECSHKLSYILDYPVYRCRNCGHRHLPGPPPAAAEDRPATASVMNVSRRLPPERCSRKMRVRLVVPKDAVF